MSPLTKAMCSALLITFPFFETLERSATVNNSPPIDPDLSLRIISCIQNCLSSSVTFFTLASFNILVPPPILFTAIILCSLSPLIFSYESKLNTLLCIATKVFNIVSTIILFLPTHAPLVGLAATVILLSNLFGVVIEVSSLELCS